MDSFRRIAVSDRALRAFASSASCSLFIDTSFFFSFGYDLLKRKKWNNYSFGQGCFKFKNMIYITADLVLLFFCERSRARWTVHSVVPKVNWFNVFPFSANASFDVKLASMLHFGADNVHWDRCRGYNRPAFLVRGFCVFANERETMRKNEHRNNEFSCRPFAKLDFVV